ncbi:MAG: hypothetical protein PHT94_02255 [Candidatus Nanoarchaeia archaeon]|nr:hypothetical protein [Candidatus Nanoarchaeia archaeon]
MNYKRLNNFYFNKKRNFIIFLSLLLVIFLNINSVLAAFSIVSNSEIGQKTQININVDSVSEITPNIYIMFEANGKTATSQLKSLCTNIPCSFIFEQIHGYNNINGNGEIKIKTGSGNLKAEKSVIFDTIPFFVGYDFKYTYLIENNKLVLNFELNNNDYKEYRLLTNIQNSVTVTKEGSIKNIESVSLPSANNLKVTFTPSETLSFLNNINNFNFQFKDKMDNMIEKEVIVDLFNDLNIIDSISDKKLSIYNNKFDFRINSPTKNIDSVNLLMPECGAAIGEKDINNIDTDNYKVEFEFNLSQSIKDRENCPYSLIVSSSGQQFILETENLDIDKTHPTISVILDKFEGENNLSKVEILFGSQLENNKLFFQFNISSDKDIHSYSFNSKCLNFESYSIQDKKLYLNVSLNDTYFQKKTDGTFDYLENYKSCFTNVTIFDNSLNNKSQTFDFLSFYFDKFNPNYDIKHFTNESVTKINQEIKINITSTNVTNSFKKVIYKNISGSEVDFDEYFSNMNLTYNTIVNISNDVNHSIIIANVTSVEIKNELKIDKSLPIINNYGFQGSKICPGTTTSNFTVVSSRALKNVTLRMGDGSEKVIFCYDKKICNGSVNIVSVFDNIHYNFSVNDVNDVIYNSSQIQLSTDNLAPYIFEPNKFHFIYDNITSITIKDDNEISEDKIKFSNNKFVVQNCSFDLWNNKTVCDINVSQYVASLTQTPIEFNATILEIEDLCGNKNTTKVNVTLVYDIQKPQITNSEGYVIEEFEYENNIFLRFNKTKSNFLIKNDNLEFEIFILESKIDNLNVTIDFFNLTGNDQIDSFKEGDTNNKLDCTEYNQGDSFKDNHNGRIIIRCIGKKSGTSWSDGLNKTINITITDFAGNRENKLQNYSIIGTSSVTIDNTNNIKKSFSIFEELPAQLLNVAANYPFSFSVTLEPIEGKNFKFDVVNYVIDKCNFTYGSNSQTKTESDLTPIHRIYKIANSNKINIENTIFLNFTNKLSDRSINNITMNCSYTYNYVFYDDNGNPNYKTTSDSLYFEKEIKLYDMTLPGDAILKTIYNDVCKNPFAKVESGLYDIYNVVAIGQDICKIKDDFAIIVEGTFEPLVDILNAANIIVWGLKIIPGLSGWMEGAEKFINNVINGLNDARSAAITFVNNIYSDPYVQGVCNALTCENQKNYNLNKNYLSWWFFGESETELPSTEDSLAMAVTSMCIPSIYYHYTQLVNPVCSYGLCILDDLETGDGSLGYNCKIEKDYEYCVYIGKQIIYSSPLYSIFNYISSLVSGMFGSDLFSSITFATNNFLANGLCGVMNLIPDTSVKNFMQSFTGCARVHSATDYILYDNDDQRVFSTIKQSQEFINLVVFFVDFDYEKVLDYIGEKSIEYLDRIGNSFSLIKNRISGSLFDEEIWKNPEDFFYKDYGTNNCKYFFHQHFSNLSILGIEKEDLPANKREEYDSLTVCKYLEEVYGEDDE